MLAVSTSTADKKKVTPNLLPCTLGYTGPVDATKRYWNEQVDGNGQKVAYFRGRKLLGRDVMIPEGFSGR